MKHLILMLQFFTRIPLPIELKVESADFPKGVRYFPVVGLVLGGLSLGVFWLLSLILGRLPALGLTLLFNVMITGALHLDGLADTCDGLFSARSKERMLEIMRDSRIGVNGAIAIFFDLSLKGVALLQIKPQWLAPALVAAPVLSRAAVAGLIFTCSPARAESGMGNLFIGKASYQDVGGAALFAVITGIVCLKEQVFWVVALNLAGIWLYRNLVVNKIGGMTGDTLGAANEVSELLTWFALVSLG